MSEPLHCPGCGKPFPSECDWCSDEVPRPREMLTSNQDTEALAWAAKAHEDLATMLESGGGNMLHVRANRALGILFAEVDRLEKILYPLGRAAAEPVAPASPPADPDPDPEPSRADKLRAALKPAGVKVTVLGEADEPPAARDYSVMDVEDEYREQQIANRDEAIERLEQQKENLLNALEAKQARIDALMLEYCPGEMSASQRAAWSASQELASVPPNTPQLEALKQALDGASVALPVLFTMCAKVGLKEGAMVADEILGGVKFAQKELAHMLSAARALETKEQPPSDRLPNATPAHTCSDGIVRIGTRESCDVCYPAHETSAPPFDVEKAKRAVRYDQKRFGNADETTNALTRDQLKVGGEYIWEPLHPHHRVRVRIDQIRTEPNGDERVKTIAISETHSVRIGDSTWNDVSRFLEACIPATSEPEVRS